MSTLTQAIHITCCMILRKLLIFNELEPDIKFWRLEGCIWDSTVNYCGLDNRNIYANLSIVRSVTVYFSEEYLNHCQHDHLNTLPLKYWSSLMLSSISPRALWFPVFSESASKVSGYHLLASSLIVVTSTCLWSNQAPSSGMYLLMNRLSLLTLRPKTQFSDIMTRWSIL